MESSIQNNNNKGYRFASIIASPSYIPNNLSTNDGETFIYINNSEGVPKAIIYNQDIVNKAEC